MSNIIAGIGRGQLEVLDKRIARRREINSWYREILKDVPGVTFQNEPTEDFISNFWLTCILIDPSEAGIDRSALRCAFDAENIESRYLWKPMHLQPVFAKSPAYVNGTAEKLFDTGLCLPSGSNMTENDLERIEGVIKNVFKL
jgi:dTDP-4-amino-4,6-dideoxygalactose transaminase